MRKQTTLWLTVIAMVALVQSSAVLASGAIKPGGAVNPRDAYVQGKSLTYEKLVCDACPIPRSGLNKDRAMSLKNSLEARDESSKPGTPDDEHIKVLDRDEQEVVHYFLKRRFKL